MRPLALTLSLLVTAVAALVLLNVVTPWEARDSRPQRSGSIT